MILAIMFKESFNGLNLDAFGVAALVIFVTCFVAIALWAGSRRPDELRRWSDLPLADEQTAIGAEIRSAEQPAMKEQR